MDAVTIVGCLGLGLFAGVLIGCVGIGGVILVPMLVLVGGLALHTAIPAANAAYLISGTIGTLVYWRAGSIPWRMAQPLALAAMPSALIGALVGGFAPAALIEVCIGALTLGSAVNAWTDHPRSGDPSARDLGGLELAIAGVVTGFGSAFTGTGGPLLLIPILMWQRCPVLPAIGMAQAIQLPIAAMATAGNAWTGRIDGTLAATLALGLAVGVWGGAYAAHLMPQATLKRLVALVLLMTGTAMLVKVAGRYFS